MVRALWDELPPDVHDRVVRIAGADVRSATSQASGFSTGVAARLVFADGGRLFLKAIQEASADTRDLYVREAEVLRRIPRQLPAAHLIEAFSQSGWFVLMIEDIDGRHPERAASSPDAPVVLDAVADLATMTAPSFLPALADELADDSGCWRRLQADGLLAETTPWCQRNVALLERLASDVGAAVSGDALVHGDLRADNILIDPSGRARLLDWPWAARGAGWEDALLYVLDLLVADPAADVDPLLEHPAFSGSAPQELNALLAAVAGAWFEKSRLPAPPGMASLREFQRLEALTASDWLARRLG